jgi:hypothetical protein
MLVFIGGFGLVVLKRICYINIAFVIKLSFSLLLAS